MRRDHHQCQAHTVGAAGVGVQAFVVFGKAYVAIVSVVLTLLILVLSEIIPKTLGALYWRQLAAPSIRMLKILIFLFHPFVVLSRKITQILSKEEKITPISREEIKAIVEVGYKDGTISKKEAVILNNLMRFGTLMAKDVMTPRPVMFCLSAELTLNDVSKTYHQFRFSRIPIYYGNPDNINHYILKNDILLSIARNEMDRRIGDFKRELLVVPETVSLFRLFDQLLDRREYFALVVDEHGGIAGIVSLEDVVETLLGIEIIDETDIAEDMQKFARNQWIQRAKRLGLISDSDEIEAWFKSLDNS